MFQFTKREKLCNRTEIQNLFTKGQSFLVYPFSVRYNVKANTSSPKVQVLLLSPKRYQKLAVSRNRVKRLIRETYRLSKENIIQFAKEEACDINISISLVSKDIPTYYLVDESMKKILNRIIINTKDDIEKNCQNN